MKSDMSMGQLPSLNGQNHSLFIITFIFRSSSNPLQKTVGYVILTNQHCHIMAIISLPMVSTIGEKQRPPKTQVLY